MCHSIKSKYLKIFKRIITKIVSKEEKKLENGGVYTPSFCGHPFLYG